MTTFLGRGAHRIIRGAALLTALTVTVASLLGPASTKPAFATGTGGYPWYNAPCAWNGSPTGPCSAYDWGESTCPSGDGNCTAGNKLNGYYLYDQWGEGFRNCTSYAAWTLSTANGFTMPFHDDAVNWGTRAQNLNYTVNMSPAPGSIYWTTSPSPDGHVAWVYSVSSDGSSVTIEDYNSDTTGDYSGLYTVSTSSASGYIHFKDLPSSYTGVGTATYTGGDSMASGTTMLPNYYLASTNVQGALIFQADSNLVLYVGSKSVWQSGTSGGNASRLVMQTDGNLVMYRADNSVVWQSGSGGHPGSYANLQNDGNFVVRDSTTVYSQTGTGGNPNLTYFGSDRLTSALGAQSLTQTQYLRSADNRYAVLLQANGDTVLYGPGAHQLWDTNTAGAGDTFTQQIDGNLVLYALGVAKWQSGKSGNSNYSVIQTDGNFVQYSSSNSPLWQSQTSGKI